MAAVIYAIFALAVPFMSGIIAGRRLGPTEEHKLGAELNRLIKSIRHDARFTGTEQFVVTARGKFAGKPDIFVKFSTREDA